jgi:hypothetical protein
MRLLLFLLGILVGIVCTGNRTEAQNYPWCGVYRDGIMICSFTTFQQCLDTVNEAGFCIQNSTYQSPPSQHPLSRVYRRYPY